MILILSIGAISANEINENNLDSIDIDSYDTISLDSVENYEDISADSENIIEDGFDENSPRINVGNSEDEDEETKLGSSILDGNEENYLETSIENEEESNLKSANNAENSLGDSNSINTNILVHQTDILKGTYLYVFLNDASGNPIPDKKVTLTFNNKSYNKTTDENGRVSLLISSAPVGQYVLNVVFEGDSNYNPSNKSFNLNVYQIVTHITVNSLTIIRGNTLYVYLRDNESHTIVGQNISITFRGTTYNKTTDSDGKASLKISSAPAGKYSTEIKYAGTASYAPCNRTINLTVDVYETHITVNSLSILRGNSLNVYLRNSSNKTISGELIKITFRGTTYNKTTDENGKVSLKISSAPAGKYTTKINFAGSTCYGASNRTITLNVYVYETHITVNSKSIIKGNYLYAYLRNSSNKTISGELIKITFRGTTYNKTTDSNGRVSLKISSAPVGSYSIKIKFAGSTSYGASSRSFTLDVYSTAGSGKKITQKTIIIDTDIIYSKSKDYAFMNEIASILRSKGYKVIVSGRGPNEHVVDVRDHSNACVLCIFGGVDAGMFVDMSSKYYQNYLKNNNNRVVLGFTVTQKDLATLDWLPRAHDDDYSPANFTGLAYPGRYLNEHGMDYIYGRNSTEMANNFLNYAVKGLSIGLNNTVPTV